MNLHLGHSARSRRLRHGSSHRARTPYGLHDDGPAEVSQHDWGGPHAGVRGMDGAKLRVNLKANLHWIMNIGPETISDDWPKSWSPMRQRANVSAHELAFMGRRRR